MKARVNPLLPCLTYFTAGRVLYGICNLASQCTMIFWPLAIEHARNFAECQGTLAMLHEFAATYRLKSVFLSPDRSDHRFGTTDDRAQPSFGKARKRREATGFATPLRA